MSHRRLRVFVSSSMQELSHERLIIKEVLKALNIDGWIFEADAGARSQTIQQAYTKEIETADLYLGLFWNTFGRYTIEEYEYARSLGKDCLVYEKRADIEGKRDPNLQAFLNQIGQVETGLTIKWFSTLEELSKFVKVDVAGWQADIVRARAGGIRDRFRPVTMPFNKLDLYDLLFLFALMLSAGYLIFSWNLLGDTAERSLWGTGILATGIVWFTVRRLSLKSATRMKSLWIRLVLFKTFLPVLLAVAWGYAAYHIYKLPMFTEATMGIYVACFENDPNNYYQNKIVRLMDDVIRVYQLSNVEIKPLTRRLTDQDDNRAWEYGRKGRASLVLWGQVLGQDKVRSRLSVIKAKGVYSTKAPIGGISAIRGDLKIIDGLPEQLTVLQEVLAIFLAGYHHYHSGRYNESIHYFQKVQSQLEGIVAKEEGITPEKSLLGSANFYLGNAHYFQGDEEKAVGYYLGATQLISNQIGGKPLFPEPLNNLGFIHKRRGDLNQAISLFKQADDACRKRESLQPCDVIEYNLGDAYAKKRMYQEAEAQFKQAIQATEAHAQNRPGAEIDTLLVGFLHQYLAYVYVKMANTMSEGVKKDGYRKAEEELDQVILASNKLGAEETQMLMNYSSLTRARILVGTSRWLEAIGLLEGLKEKLPHPDINLLLSIAYECSEQQPVADSYFEKYMTLFQTDLPSWNEGVQYEKEVTAKCRKP